MRILRHHIPITDRQFIQTPADGELLSAAVSRTAPDTHIDVWSIDYQRGVPRAIDVHIVGTGNPIPEDTQTAISSGKFLGTVVTPSRLVWHVWSGKIR